MPSSLPLAYEYCRKLCRSHYENFPVGSLLIPKSLRPHVYAIYAFSRVADDFADEPEFAGARLEHLSAWQDQLSTLFTRTPTHPVFIALRHTVETRRLTPSLFADLLHAFTLDLTKTRYQTDAELFMYCRYSANPVGRLILELFDYRDAQLFEYSDAICSALQLANHWQDLSIDCRNNRMYIPEERMRRHGVSVDDLLAGRETPELQALMRDLVAWTESLFAQGMPLIATPRGAALRGRLRWEIRLTVAGGMQILHKIKTMNYKTLNARPQLTPPDWLRLVWRVCKVLKIR